jgi:hypothetical protein
MKLRIALGIAALTLLAGCESAPEPNHTKILMRDEVQPQADIFWKSAGTIVDQTGEHDLVPTTDEGWAKTRAAAQAVIAAGELLQTPQYAEGRGEGWIRLSKGLVDIARQAEQAAIDKDGEAVFTVGGTMYDVCSACHQAYPPAEGEGEGAGE